MKYANIRDAVREWVSTFSLIPGTLIGKLGAHDEAVLYYDSDDFRLAAIPSVRCIECGETYEGDLSLAELHRLERAGRGVACAGCRYNKGDAWEMGYPVHGFPCAWGTLFVPDDGADQRWIDENRDQVARLGFYVFESEELGFILGIDGAGFDFYEAFWIPLYRLRGLEWHAQAA